MIPFGVIAAMAGGRPAPLVITIDDATLTGSDSGSAPSGSVTSNIGTVSIVSGGTGPYTYLWEIVGAAATSGHFTPNGQTTTASSFTDTVAMLDADTDETWKCTVTDTGNNNKTAEVQLTVTLTWTDTT